MATGWFPGVGRNTDDDQFLAALRATVEITGLVDVKPDDTTLVVWESALVALVEMPGFQNSAARPTLEIIYNSEPAPTLMCGCETYGYLADDYEEMEVASDDRSPSALGKLAAAWFQAQLHRPVEELVWSTWRGQRSLVRFADSGERISGVWRRPERRPREVISLRPRDARS